MLLHRIIDKIREPIQEFVRCKDDSRHVKKNNDVLSTAELIQEYDLVAMLEEVAVKSKSIDQSKLDDKRLSMED